MTARRSVALAFALAALGGLPAAARAQLHLGLEAGSFAGDDLVLEDFAASKLGSATVLGARLGYAFRLGAGNGFGVDLGYRLFDTDLTAGPDALGTLQVRIATLGFFYSYRPPGGRGLGGRMGMGLGVNAGRLQKGAYLDGLQASGTSVRITQHTLDPAFDFPMALEYFIAPWVSAGLQLRLVMFNTYTHWYVEGPHLFPGDEAGHHKVGRAIWAARHDLGLVLRLWLP